MNTFKLTDISKNTLVGRDIGKKIREKLISLIEEHNFIIIDMENKVDISPSFLEEAFVLLVINYGKDEFKNKANFININTGIKSLMNSMLSQRLKRGNF